MTGAAAKLEMRNFTLPTWSQPSLRCNGCLVAPQLMPRWRPINALLETNKIAFANRCKSARYATPQPFSHKTKPRNVDSSRQRVSTRRP